MDKGVIAGVRKVLSRDVLLPFPLRCLLLSSTRSKRGLKEILDRTNSRIRSSRKKEQVEYKLERGRETRPDWLPSAVTTTSTTFRYT